MDWTERYRLFLAANGKRWTRERHGLFARAQAMTSPFTAEQIVTLVSAEDSEFRHSRSTVYRVFFELVQAGLVQSCGPDGNSYAIVAD